MSTIAVQRVFHEQVAFPMWDLFLNMGMIAYPATRYEQRQASFYSYFDFEEELKEYSI